MEDNNIEYLKINYILNLNNHTAEIDYSACLSGDIIIPRSIKKGSEEYFVTSIKKCAFQESGIKSISFPEDSLLKTIESHAFCSSDIESLYIPSSVEDIQDGWCRVTSCLNHITISPNNKRYKICEENNMLIIGKSDITKEEYDEVIFVSRNMKLENLVLPDFIKRIKPFAFEFCQIKSVKIPENSKLREIMSNSFSYCDAESLYIPASLEKFEDGWCQSNNCLKKVTISPLNKVYKNCEENNCLIIGKSDKNKEVYDILVFASRSFTEVTIPNYIKIIAPYAFENSSINDLDNFEFSNSITFQENSKLQKIGKCSFQNCFLKEITIPKSVQTIDEFSFSDCRCLQSVVFEEGSKLQSISNCLFHGSEKLKTVKIPENSIIKSIGTDSFIATQVENLYIPSTVVELDSASLSCETFKNIFISPLNKHFKNCDCNRKLILKKREGENDCFDSIIFACRDIKNPIIPKYIKKITKFSFNNCTKLETIQFEKDSELQSIEVEAFCYSYLKGIIVPKNVCSIWNTTFNYVIKLKCAEFLAENMEFYQFFNHNCPFVQLISFPNVHKLKIFPNLWSYPQRETNFFVRSGAELELMRNRQMNYYL